MVNYGNGKIYRIVCNITGKQYIGATTIALCSRLSQHKKLFYGKKNSLSREVIEGGDYAIYLIEDYPCERKEQLLARERYYIDTFDCVNKKVPLRTKQEWYNDNREDVIKKQTEWNMNNVHRTRLYKKKYAEKQKEIRNAEINQLERDADLDVEFLNFVDIYNADAQGRLSDGQPLERDVKVYIGEDFKPQESSVEPEPNGFNLYQTFDLTKIVPNTENMNLHNVDIPIKEPLITYSITGNVKL